MHTHKQITLRQFLKELLLLLILMALVAVALSAMLATPLQRNLTFSLAIGLAIFFTAWGLALLRRDYPKSASIFVIAIPLGGTIGVATGSYLIGASPLQLLEQQPRLLLTTAIAAALFGTAISYYFYARSHIAEGKRRLQEESLNRARNEQRLIETELRLLQAQIEPHFLFNTLSNILSLTDDDPCNAKQMLQDLTYYLRASLQRTRTASTTLAQEVSLLQAYLAIQAIRMGNRLEYRIDVPSELQRTALPPLLIQPLVENAIKHGLEPMVEGGTLVIQAFRNNDQLVIEVRDTGRGLQSPVGAGVGLRNVRQRLIALYAKNGELSIEENQPIGVKATLRLPFSVIETTVEVA